MHLSSDSVIFWQYGFIKLNLTIVTTWALMLILVLSAKAITRNLVISGEEKISRWQSLLEIIVTLLNLQFTEIGIKPAQKYLPFLGTLFIFIAFSNLCAIFPFYEPPTGSLSTTVGLALCVFVAVPMWGIKYQGLLGYLRSYLDPTPVMLPLNIIGEVARTISLSVRLFGNMMSGGMIINILLIVTPFIFPVLIHLLELLTGAVQAYIFTILASVFIAAAIQSEHPADTD